MKKLLALSFIGSSLLIGSIPVKADWDYLGVKKNFDYVWEDESKRWLGSPYGIWTLNSQTGEQKLITNFCIEGASCEQRAVSFLETGEWYVQDKGAYDQSTDTWRSHTIDTFNFDAMGFSTVERPILDGLLERNSDGSLQIGLDTDDIDIVSDGLNIDGAAVITKNADGTIQIGTDENDIVTEVAEKNPISDIATVGYYYWKKGSDFVKYAEDMINKDIRVNNEFYVCPVFNQAIEDCKEIRTFDIPKMWGLGTPEDLKYYLENYK